MERDGREDVGMCVLYVLLLVCLVCLSCIECWLDRVLFLCFFLWPFFCGQLKQTRPTTKRNEIHTQTPSLNTIRLTPVEY